MSDSGNAILRIEDIEPGVIIDLYNNMTDRHTFDFFVILLRPGSKGHVKLRSADPDKVPEIVPNYFDDPRDLQVLVRYIIYASVSLICTYINLYRKLGGIET